METDFFEQPILNSPYEYPGRHWELNEDRQPTGLVVARRRPAEYITPIPKPKKQKAPAAQQRLLLDDTGLSTQQQEYDPTPLINELRFRVDQWRAIPNPSQWRVTPETARLLQHWRTHSFTGVRPFFCQIEAVETAIWLTEVAPDSGVEGRRFLEHLEKANNDANPGLMRLALKLATGAGKTSVMAMLIAWQTVNAVRHPNSRRFTRGFLVVAPGITIKDRLRVLQPNDPDSYYARRELVPTALLEAVPAGTASRERAGPSGHQQSLGDGLGAEIAFLLHVRPHRVYGRGQQRGVQRRCSVGMTGLHQELLGVRAEVLQRPAELGP